MFRLVFLTVCWFYLAVAGCQQPTDRITVHTRPVGGACEGCEATLEYGTRALPWQDTLPGYSTTEHPISVSGTVYQVDGTTPAAGIVLYVYHTDEAGIYAATDGATGWAKRHGERRTWLQTDKQGRYRFYTARPAAYPDTRVLAHIHIFIKEPSLNPYYIDDFVFADDPYLTESTRASLPNRGGSGILADGVERAGRIAYTRDIILGQHIPNYPQN